MMLSESNIKSIRAAIKMLGFSIDIKPVEEENRIDIIFLPETIGQYEASKMDRAFEGAVMRIKKNLEVPAESVTFNRVMSTNGLIATERETFPLLYHSTSSFFIDSIKEHGLGGISIHEKYKLEEMADDLYNGFVDAGLFPPLEKENADFWIINIPKDKDLISAWVLQSGFGMLYKAKCSKKTSFAYGELYFTTSLGRAISYSNNSFGEYLNTILLCFDVYHKKTGKFFRFSNAVHQELMDSIFDYETCAPKKEYKPVVLIVRDIPLNNILTEGSRERLTSNLSFINYRATALWEYIPPAEYIKEQKSYIYDGPAIDFNDITVVEDLNELEKISLDILGEYTEK